ncbi:MAG: cell division protein ZapE [Alphaproteobacteria bacterium]|nr:cell division protein ZapE [Alphaproteobacteria bacterium]
MGAVSENYAALVAAGKLEANEWQYAMAARFDQLLARLEAQPAPGFFARFFKQTPMSPKGMYIYGAVGRGKTMLMDLFYSNLARQDKLRTNFNEFMQEAQKNINFYRTQIVAGKIKQQDPIDLMANALRKQVSILCFDEFAVTDIADATILARLFQKLFAKGMVLVATSNVAPVDLYKNGLNRELFLPFIPILEQYCEVINATVEKDFRLGKGQTSDHYFYPLNEASAQLLQAKWQQYTQNRPSCEKIIKIKGHDFKIPHYSDKAAFFTFSELCAASLSAADYTALAQEFNVIFIADIPQLDDEMRNWAKRFTTLIDILYDNNVQLYISAAADPMRLYIGQREGVEKFEYARTASRLIEMQSSGYLAQWRQKYNIKT